MAVAQVVLNRPSVSTIISQLVPATVTQHMRMDRERELCCYAGTLDHETETGSGHGSPALGQEDVATGFILPLQAPQCPDLGSSEGLFRAGPILESGDSDQ